MTKIVADLSCIAEEITKLEEIGWFSKSEVIEVLRLITLALRSKYRVAEGVGAIETVVAARFRSLAASTMTNNESQVAIVSQVIAKIAMQLCGEYSRLGMYNEHEFSDYALIEYIPDKQIAIFTNSK